MKVSVNAKEFSRMLKTAERFVDKSGILSGHLALSVHDGKFEIIVVSLDGDTAILRQWVDAGDVLNDDFEQVQAEDGFRVVQNVKDLSPLKKVEKSADIVIESEKNTMTVTAPGFSFEVHVGNPDEYPLDAFRVTGGAAETVDIVPDDCECFRYVIPAVSDDISRPDFTGAVLRDGTLVATDGHRLHHCPVPALFGTGTFDGIISSKLLRLIAGGRGGTLREYRETKERKEKVNGKTVATTYTEAVWHVLEAPGLSMEVKPINGQFPDFFRVIPSYRIDETAEIDAETLAKVIKPLYAGWKINLCMKLFENPDGVKLECAGKPSEKAANPPHRIGILEDTKLPNVPIFLNPRYIVEALDGFSGKVTFCCMDMNSPVWVGEYDGGKVGKGALIMPMEPF